MAATSSFPLIETGGAPHARGLAYGEQARERIGGSLEIYAAQLGRLGFDKRRIDRFASTFMPRVADWAPDLIEEMKGIATGANLERASILLINARTEILQLAKRKGAVEPEDPDCCTGAVILPEATRHGELIHGQNWDWKAECAQTAIVLRIRRENGPDILTFTEAGGLARSGFNSAGICVTANYLESDRDYRQLGIPLPFIRRRALEAGHFALALKVVATTPKSGSNNMMVSTAEGFAVNLECAPDEAFAIYPDESMIVHANHWQSPIALSKLKETGLIDVPDSLYRDHRVRSALAARRGDIVPDDLKAALFDDFGAPYSVCRPPVEKDSGNLSATVAMIILEPAKGIMELAPLPALNKTFTRYELAVDSTVANRIVSPRPAQVEGMVAMRDQKWSVSS